MGLFGITEGAIPFASTDPLRAHSKHCNRGNDRKCDRDAFRSDRSCSSWRSDRSGFRSSGSRSHVFVAVIAGIAVTVLMLRILKPTLQQTAVAAANGVTVADLSETETSDVYTKTETFDSITDIMSDEAIVLK